MKIRRRRLLPTVLLINALLAGGAAIAQEDSAPATSQDIQALIGQARGRLQQGDTKGALDLYEEVLARDPDNLVALYFAGNISLQTNQVPRGLALLSRAATLAPADARLWLLLGKAYETFATPDDALRAYQHLLDTSPNAPEAEEANKRYLLLTGKKAAAQGNTQQAQEIFSQLLNDYPKDPTVLTEIKAFNLAREQTRAGAASELTPEKLSEAAKLSSSDIPSLLAEGKKRLEKNDSAGALQIYEAVLVKDRNNLEALFFAGNLQLRANQPEQGLNYLSRGVELVPKNLRLRQTLAQAYERYSRLGEAAQQYKEIAALGPDTPEGIEANKKSQLLLARIALQQAKPEEAEAIFNRLAQQYPDDADLRSQIEAARQAHRQTEAAAAGSAIAPSATMSPEISAMLSDAKARLGKGDAQGALEAFEAVLAKDPNNVDALYFAGNLELRANKVQEGLGHLSRSTELAPGNIRLRLTLAQSFERYQFFGDAMREYQSIVQMNPTSPEGKEADKRLQLLETIRAISDNDMDKSLSVIEATLKKFAYDPALTADAVNVYLRARRLDYAERMLQDITRQAPGDVNAQYFLADMYERQGKIDQTIRQYDVLLKLLPADDPQAKAVRSKQTQMKAALAFSTGALDDARKYFEQASAMEPDNLPLRLNLAATYRKMGDLGKAEAVLNEMLEKSPDFPDARLRLGAIYIQQNRLDDAAREFEEVRVRAAGSPAATQAAQTLSSIYSLAQGGEIRSRVEGGMVNAAKEKLKAEPDNEALWARLGLMALLFNQRDDAQTAYENVARLQPTNVRAQEILAGLYDDANQYSKAEDAYTKARDNSQDPAFRQAVERKLVMVSAKRAYSEKRWDMAEAKFKQAVTDDPKNYIALFFLGLLHSRDGRYAEAVKDYEQLIKVVPAHSAAHYQLGLLYEQLQRDEDALAEYRTMMRIDSIPELKQSAEARIPIVEKRIDGFDYSLNYSLNYSDNPNLTTLNPAGDMHSDLAGTINYHHKIYRRPMSVGLSVTPTYVDYHVGQSDNYSFAVTPYASWLWEGINYSSNLTYSESNNYSTGDPISKGFNFNSDMSSTFNMPAVLPWFATDELRHAAPTTWRLSIAANKFTSDQLPINNALLYTFTGSLSQSFRDDWRISGNYTLSKNVNTEAIGSDLAYLSNGLSGQLIKSFGPKLSVFGGYAYTRYSYTNPDSFSLYTKTRKSGNYSLSLGGNYFLDQNLRLFSSVSYTINRTSLPTGYTLSPQDVGVIVGFQSNALGNYQSFTASAGIAFSF